MTLDSTTLNKIVAEITEMFPNMNQDDVECITSYMGRHQSMWVATDIPGGVRKCLPIALVQKDHSAYLLLGIILTMFINMLIQVVLYLATTIYSVPYKNKNIDPVIM